MLPPLQNPDLIRYGSFVAGKWINQSEAAKIRVVNPANQTDLVELAGAGYKEIGNAISAAYEALSDWRARTAQERGTYLWRWYEAIQAHREDLALIMCYEQGKPLAEARSEIDYAASFLSWYAEEGRRAYGEVIPGYAPDRRIMVIKQPIGVVGAITPWNFPAAMIARKIAPALAAGCTIVAKPASETPLTALALAYLAQEVDMPQGVLNMLVGDAQKIGETLTGDERIRKIAFTGSTQIGRKLMAQSAPQVKKISLELGGNAPLIVFEDADIDHAVEQAILCKYRNAGQTCICANRLYVQDRVFEEFLEKFTQAVKKLKIGYGWEEDVKIGPLISQNAVEKVGRLIRNATEKGAKIMYGGKPHERGQNFFQPTILTDVHADMDLACEEIFGPVAPLFRFHQEEDVIKAANNTIYGLASYIFSRDIHRVWRVAEALEYGMVAINSGLLSTEIAPFGGIKQSGIGREGGFQGLEEYLETKYLNFQLQ